MGSRSATSRATTAIGSTVIHQVPAEGFSQLQSPRITLVGNLGRDVEVRQVNTRKGPMEVGTTSLAVNQDDKSTMWVKLSFWNADAHAAAENLRKGMKVEVFGFLKQANYKRKDGSDASSVEVTVNSLRQVEVTKKQQQASFSGNMKPTMGAADQFINEEEEY